MSILQKEPDQWWRAINGNLQKPFTDANLNQTRYDCGLKGNFRASKNRRNVDLTRPLNRNWSLLANKMQSLNDSGIGIVTLRLSLVYFSNFMDKHWIMPLTPLWPWVNKKRGARNKMWVNAFLMLLTFRCPASNILWGATHRGVQTQSYVFSPTQAMF